MSNSPEHPLVRREPLTPAQRQAVRLEIAGSRPVDVAKALGVVPATVQKWRKLPEYRAHREMLQATSDADALDDARALRLAASRVLRRVLEAVDQALDEGMRAEDAIPAAKLVLEVYRATSAQTGLGETQHHQVTVGAPEAALAELRRIVQTVPNEALDVIEKS